MGVRIEAAATEHRRGRLFGRGALHLADAAARKCLERAHHAADDLDILINTALYRDHNVAEPALASLIQEDIKANLGHPPRLGHHGTFSFDVLNGGCGVVTAARLVDGFISSGAARHGMVVTADADPSPGTSRNFPFSPLGGAMMLASAPDSSGFQRFELRTFVEDAGLFEAYLRWDAHAGLTHRGRNVLEVIEAPEFASRCVDHATEVVTTVLAATNLQVSDLDLVIASQYPRTFAVDLANRLGITADRVPRVENELTATHTAGPIAALEAAMASRRFAEAHHTLFVTAGAGITIGVALYVSA